MLTAPSDRNTFLAALSPTDYELFRPHLTDFTLNSGERLQNLGAVIERVVFPHACVIALTMPLRDGGGGGAILIGRDGILGALGAAAAAPAMCDAEVCIAGRAAHMSASAFRYVLDQSLIIGRLVGRHNAALMVQAHQTALCNAAHPVEARVSRLLREAQDRGADIDIPLTQTKLAQMLGVNRTTVNLAARKLEETGLIHCRRGYIRILRREKLEKHACECYGNLKSYVSGVFAVPVVTTVPASQREPMPPKSPYAPTRQPETRLGLFF